MSPRPRRNTDLQIIRAVFRAIARVGSAKLTLATVADEAGVTAASLIQRFGSRRALLLATAADAASGHIFIFEGLRARHRSPKAALLGLAECMTMLGGTPEEVAHTLAFLQSDLTDPEFHQHALTGSRAFHAGIRGLVRDAIAAGELQKCDADRLSRAVQATLNGSTLEWTIHREGMIVPWVRRDLRTLLAPYSAKPTS